MNKRC